MYYCPNCEDEIRTEDVEHLGFCSFSCKQEVLDRVEQEERKLVENF